MGPLTSIISALIIIAVVTKLIVLAVRGAAIVNACRQSGVQTSNPYKSCIYKWDSHRKVDPQFADIRVDAADLIGAGVRVSTCAVGCDYLICAIFRN